MVTWNSGGDQDGANGGVFAQRFDSKSNRVGEEFQVNKDFYLSSEPEDALPLDNEHSGQLPSNGYYGAQWSDVVLGKILDGQYEIENEQFANQFTDGNQRIKD